MLIFDFAKVGNKLYEIRKRAGMTQWDVAEAAGLSDRTYADIERGSVNMRSETVLSICRALNITPDDIFTEDAPNLTKKQEELMSRLEKCTPRQRETALDLLSVYIDSLK